MKKNYVLFFVFISVFSLAQHKFLNIPKLDEKDVSSTVSSIDPEAPAEVLYRSYHYRLDVNGNMYTDVIDRVKIYKKDKAGDFLDHEVSTYDNGRGSREIMSSLKAVTYNMENGKVVSTKVESDSKFKSKEDKNYTVNKFAFQNVKDGSVVEYVYKISTPFLNSTPIVYIEDKIPVRYVEFVFDTPKFVGYNINYKGSLAPKHRSVKQDMIYGSEYQVYRFGYENVPAYKEENYVQNNNNYKTALRAEINSIMSQKEGLKSFALSWTDIQKRLMEDEDFGLQLKRMNLVKDILPKEITEIKSTMTKADAVLKFVQKNYTFNNDHKLFTDNGIKNLITTKSGNVAEINLLLTMLLRSVDIDADPVALSTVKRGLLLSYSPSLNQMNYVISSFQYDGKFYLLDGTSKFSKINMLPTKAFNYTGILLKGDKAEQLNIMYPNLSQTFLTVDAKMNPDGTFEGHFADRDTNLYGMMVTEQYFENKEDYQKEYKTKYTFPFTNLKSGVQENDDFETSFDFNSDTFTDVLGSKLVFNPLLFLYTQNHSFNQTQERKAPLEFVSKSTRVKKVTITLPEGYVFENIPTSKKFRTQENEIQYSYVVKQEGNKLTVETTTAIDDSVYPKEYYPAFKQIYDNITKMEGQMVTAVKK